jgi:hypothetical protein
MTTNRTVKNLFVKENCKSLGDINGTGELEQGGRSTITARATAITTVTPGPNTLTRIEWDPATVVKTGTDIDIDPSDPTLFVVNSDGDYVFFATATYEPFVGGYRNIYLRSPSCTGQQNFEAADVGATSISISHGDYMTAGQNFYLWGIKYAAGDPPLNIDPALGPVRIFAYKI